MRRFSLSHVRRSRRWLRTIPAMRCSTERGRGSVERREIRCPKRSEWRHPHTGPSQVGLCLNQTADPAPMLSNRAREPAVEEAVK